MKQALFITLALMIGLYLFAIEVSGEQYGLWSLDNSPYLLTGDVEVPEGTILVIEPGVTVRAMGNFRLNVAGEIQAIGTPADSIRFENGQTPPTEVWQGVRFENHNLQSNFKHCIFEYADYGLNSIDSPAEISYCRFSYNIRGIHLFGIGNPDPAVVNVHNNILEHSVQNGIIIAQNSNAWIHHNEVRYNGTSPQYFGAIQLSNQSPDGHNDPIIEHNYVHHNLKQGITAFDVTGTGAINATIRYNHVEANLTGIYLLYSSGVVHDNLIINNFIPGDTNSGAGMMIGGAASSPYIAGNTLTGNFTAFYLALDSVPILGDISSDHPFAYGENIIQNNIDESGTLHAIACANYTAGDNIIMAQNNDWGAYTSDEIQAGITDHSDNPAFPTVIFEPWLEPSTEPMITGSFDWDSDDYDNISASQLKLHLVSVNGGNILEEHLIDANPFSFETAASQAFYAILCARNAAEDIWAGAGGLDELTIFDPAETTSFDLGEIYIQKDKHYDREITGPAVDMFGLYLMPVYKSFLVYKPYDIKYFSVSGYARSLIRQDVWNGSAYTMHMYPGDTLFDKTGGFAHGEVWEQVYYEGDGTVNLEVLTYIDQAGNPSFSYTSGALMHSQEFIDEHTHRRYIYDNAGYAETYYEIINVGTNERRFYPRQNVDHPTNFRYLVLDISSHPGHGNTVYSRDLLLWWQAPARNPLHAYEGYKLRALSNQLCDPVLDEELPFDQYTAEVTIASQGTTMITLFAYQGDYFSQAAESIILEYAVSSDDLVQQPQLKVYPNPVCFDRGETLKIESKELMQAEMRVYNLRGQLVFSDIVTEENYSWNGKNSQGRSLGNGVYMLRIEALDGKQHQRKILIMK